MKRELAIFGLFAAVFAACYWLPVDWIAGTFGSASLSAQAAELLRDYAREHVLLCLVPALFIAGGIAVFLSQAAVLRYLGARAKPWIAYGVASVSGSVLAVCSCTILPLFAGIYRMGAGLGPASAFLYSGPAINVLAILLTARVLGFELGVARAGFAISFGLLIGVAMHFLFRKEEARRSAAPAGVNTGRGHATEEIPGGLTANVLLLGGLVFFLIFATWQPATTETPFFADVAPYKWPLALSSVGVSGFAFWRWKRGQGSEWVEQTWTLSKQILPLLFIGVLVSGFVFGTPGGSGLIPREWVTGSVGGNSWSANFVAAASGALMYFATLTEIPILQGLMGHGMGQGPALALLLAGPAVSLPSLLVIRGVLGLRKTLAFAALVIVLASVAGKIFGMLIGTGASS